MTAEEARQKLKNVKDGKTELAKKKLPECFKRINSAINNGQNWVDIPHNICNDVVAGILRNKYNYSVTANEGQRDEMLGYRIRW